MTTNTKKILTITGFFLVLLLVAGGVIFVLPRLTTTRPIAPTAPESKPQAADWIGNRLCNVDLVIKGPGACLDLLYYIKSDSTWEATTAAEIKNRIAKGDEIRIAAESASPSAGLITKARFKINDATGWTESTTDNSNGWFYITYKVDDYGTHSVTAEVLDVSNDASASSTWRASDDCIESFDLPEPEIAACDESCGSDGDCEEGLSCEGGMCRNPECVGETDCICPVACDKSCKEDSDCSGDNVCSGGMCRNEDCLNETDCVCPGVTPTPTRGITPTPTSIITPTPTSIITPTPTTVELPEAGLSLPTVGALGGGLIMVLLGILLAL